MKARSEKSKRLREAGIPDDEIPNYLGEADAFWVHPENHEAAKWFLMLQRRWVFSEMSGTRQRLDDSAIESQMNIRGIKRKHREKLLDALMIMESAALEELNK